MKFSPVGVAVFHGEERTEKTKPSVAVHFSFRKDVRKDGR